MIGDLATPCDRPPAGWGCTRGLGHDGPCAAHQLRPLWAPLLAATPLPRAEPSADVPAALMHQAGGHGRLLWHNSFNWSSNNFDGTRDEIALEFFGPEAAAAGEQMIDNLRQAIFNLSGRIVTDVKIGYHSRLPSRTIVLLELIIVKD